jgi:hypothetical protein
MFEIVGLEIEQTLMITEKLDFIAIEFPLIPTVTDFVEVMAEVIPDASAVIVVLEIERTGLPLGLEVE